ncbi:MAG: nitroreductase [Sphingomonadales bacterium]|nr:nitroreductase [Sphingomonadales bacterium]MBD3772647.1 nitroreductase [Paracoccaceae bacterium]
MDIAEAVASRRSIRRFLDRPVDAQVLARVLERARRAPSGGNVQPWNAAVLSGAALARLKEVVAQAIPQGLGAWSAEYAIYPPGLAGDYLARRFAVGEAMYAALGIGREDKEARRGQFADNFAAFGAPVLMLVHTPRYMGPPQWADIGMWLQTIMLLLRGEGLDSCAQEAWAVYQKQIREVVPIPEDHIFFCGMAIGWRDPDAPINNFPVPRAALGESVSFYTG